MSNDDQQLEEDMEIELPPALAKFVADIEKAQKQLLKDKRLAHPDQLRQFIGLHVMEMLSMMVKALGTTMYDTHMLSVSNARQLQNMRRWTADHLRKLGADVGNDDAFAGVGTDEFDALGQAMFALGSYLQTAHPDDKDGQRLFNNVAAAYNEMAAAMMGYQAADEEDDEEEDDEEEEERDEKEEGDEEAAGSPDADAPSPGGPDDGDVTAP